MSIPTAPHPYAPPPQSHRGWVAVVITCLGAVVILSIVVSGLVTALRSGATQSASSVADTDGVTALKVDIAAGELDVVFDDVSTATLDVESHGWADGPYWELARRGDVLVISTARTSWRLFGWNDDARATLFLPAELEGLIDADLKVSAGRVDFEGDVTTAKLTVDAGQIGFDGSSSSVDVEVSAGDARVTTSDVQDLRIEVAVGNATVDVTGPQPSSSSVSVEVGSANLRLPDGEYALTGSASLGERSIDVRTNPSSEHALKVDVSVGEATVGYTN